MKNVSIVISTYNNLKDIKNYFDDTYKLLENNNEQLEIILIDKNSQDRILDVFKDYYPLVTIKDNCYNISQKEFIAEAIQLSKYNNIIIIEPNYSFNHNQYKDFLCEKFDDYEIQKYDKKTLYVYKNYIFDRCYIIGDNNIEYLYTIDVKNLRNMVIYVGKDINNFEKLAFKYSENYNPLGVSVVNNENIFFHTLMANKITILKNGISDYLIETISKQIDMLSIDKERITYE